MVARIDDAGPPPPLPGVSVGAWDSTTPAEIHQVMVRAYAGGGGEVGPYEAWRTWFTGDDEFDPSTCFVAHEEGAVAGVCLCWSSAFVKDLCVDPAAQGRGIGAHLLRTAMATFAGRGLGEVSLKVEADNARAIRLYERCGFTPAPPPSRPSVPGTGDGSQ